MLDLSVGCESDAECLDAECWMLRAVEDGVFYEENPSRTTAHSSAIR